jgi:hypothetical protein
MDAGAMPRSKRSITRTHFDGALCELVLTFWRTGTVMCHRSSALLSRTNLTVFA